MQNQQEVREFLTSRRARITPEAAGLTADTNRRVPGLRRSEVAMLAGVSVEYYSRVERGALAGVSDNVLDAVSRALQLDDAERSHLTDLARIANSASIRPRRRKPVPDRVRPTVQYLLDAIDTCPAVIRNARLDLIAGNRLWYALYAPMYAGEATYANLARFTFLDLGRSERFFSDWNEAANICVEVLRVEAGRNPYDRDLQDLVGELSTRSDDFRRRWAAHDVRAHGTGRKRFHHEAVGDLELTYEEMALASDPGLTLLTYVPAAGSPSEDALRLLSAWAATRDSEADHRTGITTTRE